MFRSVFRCVQPRDDDSGQKNHSVFDPGDFFCIWKSHCVLTREHVNFLSITPGMALTIGFVETGDV